MQRKSCAVALVRRSGRGQKLLPVFGRRHVVPGLEGRRERADVVVTEQHRDLERLQALVTEVTNGQFRADLLQHLLEARLFGLQPALQRSARQFQGTACSVRVGLTLCQQVGEPAPQLSGDIVAGVERADVLFCLFDQGLKRLGKNAKKPHFSQTFYDL